MDGHQGPPPPPPPPPHGANPKSSGGNGSGLPPGNYDIFIIPPHSSGSGFLYLPSLRPQMNSFIAGAASAFFACWIWARLSPMLKAFVHTVSQSGAGFGMLLMLGVVAIGAFFAGSAGQIPGAGGAAGGGATGGQAPPPNGYPPSGAHTSQAPPPQPNGYENGSANGYAKGASNGHAHGHPNGHAGGPPPQQQWGHGPQAGYARSSYDQPPQHHETPPPPPPPPRTEPYGARSEADGSERAQPRPRAYSNASASWQKAKEEQRRREDERRKEEEQKRKDEEAKKKAAEEAKAKAEAERKAKAAEEKLRWEKQRAREKEERERKERERLARERLEKAKADAERIRMEKELKERLEKEAAELQAKAAELKEKADREAREAAARERLAQLRAKSELGTASSQRFGVGERTNPYSLDPNDRTPTPAATAAQAAAKKYERPTAQSYIGTSTGESYRPYDKHKHTGSGGSSVYSESYAPSQSTAPSTAPPRQSGPYSTTDPGKVVLKAVYSFSDSFPKPQTSLVAGQDGVTDGLILKIGTEGMFVDDDVRGIGLREWDVKTWTMRSVESISIPKKSLYILRTTLKDAVKTNFVFIVGASEEWKAKKGVEVLKGGSLAALAKTGLVKDMALGEATRLMNLLGW